MKDRSITAYRQLKSLKYQRDESCPGDFVKDFLFSVCVVLRRFVTDASVSLFVAILLFVFPSEPPYFLCFWRSSDTGNTCTRQFTHSEHVVNVATKL